MAVFFFSLKMANVVLKSLKRYMFLFLKLSQLQSGIGKTRTDKPEDKGDFRSEISDK